MINIEVFVIQLSDFEMEYHSFLCLMLQVLFIYLDTSNEDNARILEFFGLKPEQCPAIRLITLTDDMTKFKPETDDLGTDSVKAFVQSVLDGKLKVSRL